jgi:hypothetical protein
MVATKSMLLFVAVSGLLVADAFGFAPASGLSLARRASNLRAGISLRMSGEERKLTNEECELLGLPNGSTLVGEESEMMKTKLTVKVRALFLDVCVRAFCVRAFCGLAPCLWLLLSVSSWSMEKHEKRL